MELPVVRQLLLTNFLVQHGKVEQLFFRQLDVLFLLNVDGSLFVHYCIIQAAALKHQLWEK